MATQCGVLRGEARGKADRLMALPPFSRVPSA